MPMDSVSVNERVGNKIETYRNVHLPNYTFSDVRLNSLEETIEFLKEFGNVYLVRLPVAVEILDIENDQWSDYIYIHADGASYPVSDKPAS